jgi:hypothetical protein
MIQITDKRVLKYFIPPPIHTSIVEYQDINKDKNLRDIVTNYFLEKIIKWIKLDKKFNHLKDKIELLESSKGYNIVYNLLRQYVKSNNCNWYDLRGNKNIIKDYFKYNIGKI